MPARLTTTDTPRRQPNERGNPWPGRDRRRPSEARTEPATVLVNAVFVLALLLTATWAIALVALATWVLSSVL